ncbi:MAG: SDR family NAD(P)-dependent oxidoreductase, partial [Pseudomonadota bacterium]
MTLAGQRALVTGAASGIGAACVTALCDAGAEVVGADISPADGLIPCDVSDAGSVDEMFAAAGKLDCVVNAAGILLESRVIDMSPEAFDRQIAVNLRGSFLVAQGAARSLGGNGRLILIASELAHLGRAGFAAYCASKAG